MLTLLFCLTFATDKPIKLGLGMPWYDEQKSAETTIEGILDYQTSTGKVGIPAGFSPFRLVRRVGEEKSIEQFTVQAPGHELQLANLVGYRVNVVGKVRASVEGESKRQVLWVGSIQSLSLAPALVFTEVQPFARTSKFTAFSAKPLDYISMAVMRNNQDVNKALNLGEGIENEKMAVDVLKSSFGIKTIDWKNQMVVYIGPVRTNPLSNRKLEITKVEVHERGATVYWKADEQLRMNAAPSTDTVLLPRIDGEITFKEVAGKKRDPNAPAPVAPEKLVPTAPIK
jgi:hypothetical protein